MRTHDVRRDGLQVHADQVELQPERGEVLAHRVVQKLGEHVALELLRLQRAQHRMPQFLFGGVPGSDLPRQAAGVANLPIQPHRESRDVIRVAVIALAQVKRFAAKIRCNRESHRAAPLGRQQVGRGAALSGHRRACQQMPQDSPYGLKTKTPSSIDQPMAGRALIESTPRLSSRSGMSAAQRLRATTFARPQPHRGATRPYFSIIRPAGRTRHSDRGCPRTPWGRDAVSATTCATRTPRPPSTRCSSATTIAPVSAAARRWRRGRAA